MVNKPSPPPIPTPSAAVVAFAGILQALGQTIAASQERGVAARLVVAIWGRVIRMSQRFAAIAAHVAAGTLRPPRVRPAYPARATSAREPTYPRVKLAGGIGWLCVYVPEARNYGRYVRILLADPEMVALLEAAPQLGGILRSLCRMLKVEPVPALIALPSRLRVIPPGAPGSSVPARSEDVSTGIARSRDEPAGNPEPRPGGRRRTWKVPLGRPIPEWG